MNGISTMLIYHNWLPVFEALNPEDAGRLIIALIRFSIDGTQPDFEDSPMLNGITAYMCNQIGKNIEKYQRQRAKYADYWEE